MKIMEREPSLNHKQKLSLSEEFLRKKKRKIKGKKIYRNVLVNRTTPFCLLQNWKMMVIIQLNLYISSWPENGGKKRWLWLLFKSSLIITFSCWPFKRRKKRYHRNTFSNVLRFAFLSLLLNDVAIFFGLLGFFAIFFFFLRFGNSIPSLCHESAAIVAKIYITFYSTNGNF